MTIYRAAVAQLAAHPYDPMASATKAVEYIHKAADDGVKLMVLPEAYLGFYPKGSLFGALVGSRSPEGRVAFQRYYEASIDVPGPEIALLEEACRATGMYVVVGCIERDNGTLYCTALHISPEGGLVAKHRKLMPTAGERLIWGFGDGSTMPVVDTPLGKVGAVICWENYMPMLRMHMYKQGVGIYCAPTADDRPRWTASMQHIALEGRCFVLSACQYITRGAYPADYDCGHGNDPATVLINGGSCIINPLGEILVGPDFKGEGVFTAEIDTDQLIRGKYDFDPVGHYARPDIFELRVRTTANPAVSYEN